MNRFREVLGHFCTGVTVVTTVDGGVPAGFACQSFAALSLDPPLVLFCPDRRSGTWPVIARTGVFCVNVLAADQRAVSRAFGTRGADKFAAVDWTRSPGGGAVLEGALTWVDCVVRDVHEAGDHYVVIGEVTGLGPCRDQEPLVYYQGRYTSEPEPLLAWPAQADWL